MKFFIIAALALTAGSAQAKETTYRAVSTCNMGDGPMDHGVMTENKGKFGFDSFGKGEDTSNYFDFGDLRKVSACGKTKGPNSDFSDEVRGRAIKVGNSLVYQEKSCEDADGSWHEVRSIRYIDKEFAEVKLFPEMRPCRLKLVTKREQAVKARIKAEVKADEETVESAPAE